MARLAPTIVASLIFSIAACVNGSSSFAQSAGSTGGTIGKHNKSVSGGEERSAKVGHGSAHRAKPTNKESSRPSRKGSVALYEGTWNGVSTGRCIAGWNWTLQVNDGVISGSSTTGHVSGGGAIRGVMNVVGTAYNFVGHIHRDEASGTWKSRPGCYGTWTATR